MVLAEKSFSRKLSWNMSETGEMLPVEVTLFDDIEAEWVGDSEDVGDEIAGWFALLVNGYAIAWLEYSFRRDKASIDSVHVNPDWKQEGISDLLFERMDSLFPDTEVNIDLAGEEASLWRAYISRNSNMWTRRDKITSAKTPDGRLVVEPKPTRYFSQPMDNQDPRVIDIDTGDVHDYVSDGVTDLLFIFWRDQGLKNPEEWTKAWIAGSALAYQWDAADDVDLDVLMAIEVDKFLKENPDWDGPTTGEGIARELNRSLRVNLWPDTAGWMGFDTTFYVNSDINDITEIKPYAAYDVINKEWVVLPILLPEDWNPYNYFSDDQWAQIDREVKLAIEYAHRYNALIEEYGDISPDSIGQEDLEELKEIESKASDLFDSIRGDRSTAFSSSGQGFLDFFNFRWQAHKEMGSLPVLHTLKWLNTFKSSSVLLTGSKFAGTQKVAARTGCIVALTPPESVAQALGEAAGDMSEVTESHVTIAYLGDIEDVDTDALESAVEAFAEDGWPLEATLGGWGTFNNDDEHVLYASVDAPTIEKWREVLVDYLVSAGLEPSEEHGFTAHITVSYRDEPITELPEFPEVEPFVIDEVEVFCAGERTAYPLQSQPIEKAALTEDDLTRLARSGGDMRGNSTDRRRRKVWLLNHYGNGDTVPCYYCNTTLDFDTVTSDRIIPGSLGGRYTRDNLVPSCEFDNKSRGDQDIDAYRELVAEQMLTEDTLSVVAFAERFARVFTAEELDYEAAAEVLIGWAEDNEKDTTPVLQEVAKQYGGEMQGLDFRIKAPDSLKRKLRTKVLKSDGQITQDDLIAEIQDALRYTIEFPTEEYTEGVHATMNKLEELGYYQLEVENTWLPGDPYSGINTNYKTPNGLAFELQFHTGESFQTKTENHILFEEFRLPETDLRRRMELYRIMADTWNSVPIPEGATDIGQQKIQHPPTPDDLALVAKRGQHTEAY